MKKSVALKNISNNQSHALLSALPYNAFVFTEQGDCIEAFVGNEATVTSFDYKSLVGLSLKQMLSPELAKRLQNHISKALESDLTETIVHPVSAADLAPEFQTLTGPNDTLWFEGKATRISTWEGEASAVMWLSSDITLTISREQKIKALIEMDALTGARSRRSLLKYLRHAYRNKVVSSSPYSLLYIEVRDYPTYKKDYGLVSSENLLKLLSDFFQQHLSPLSKLYRFEGSDFVAILPNTGYEVACSVAKKLTEKLINTEIEVGHHALTIPIDVGVAESHSLSASRPLDVLYRANENVGKYHLG
ncbi:diguanylate cyclase domain-containing protein [Vibrio maritimus]